VLLPLGNPLNPLPQSVDSGFAAAQLFQGI
jgi:hypothetical protein